ncbi:metallophosphoesterase family protein [Thalassospira sp.]|uniref:metallophosphoesterase family protein n=1 Tax=Thalassospira sp. TaxID=1912094 RepID=UPI003AA92361
MKILVLSDVHAVSTQQKQDAGPSYVCFANTRRTPISDPLIGLATLLDEGAVSKPDMIICAGDLGNQADAVAISSVWTELHQLCKKHAIPHLIGTCGNHDLDTRHKHNKFDPNGFLRALEPAFPVAELAKTDLQHLQYWANNFSIIEEGKFRVLNINSCAYHGFGEGEEPEFIKGRVSDYTIDAIKRDLRDAISRDKTKLNICIFHHHLKKIDSDVFDDVSVMKGAERLVNILSEAALGDWLVVHGHRHRSDLYYTGGNSGPLVLSCASFSATRENDKDNPSENQFYLIELEENQAAGHSKIKGQIRAWNWITLNGWLSATKQPDSLPSLSGFGFRGSLFEFSDKLHAAVIKQKRLKWADAVNQFPDLLRLIPRDLEDLIGLLDRDYQDIVVSPDEHAFSEIVRKT